MHRMKLWTLAVALIITASTVILWQSTGGDFYTKFEIVEQVPVKPDAGDPLAAAGFYEGKLQTTTEIRPEFHFGLLPTPSHLFDKHALSLLTIVAPVWAVALAMLFFKRSRKSAARTPGAHGRILTDHV